MVGLAGRPARGTRARGRHANRSQAGRSTRSADRASSSSRRTRACSAGGRRSCRRRPPARVDQQHSARPVYVAQEAMTETLCLARPLDEPRDVGHDVSKPSSRRTHRVGSNVVKGSRRSWAWPPTHGSERGLADVREADRATSASELELELEPALLTHLALLGEHRGPALVGQEARVALPASPAGGRQPAIALIDEVGQHDASRSRTTVPSARGR